jgi:predicted ester cyclase
MAHRTRHLLVATLAAAATASTASFAAPGELAPETARAIVAPFYDALTAVPGKDVRALVEQATRPDWESCSGNATCRSRDGVVEAVSALEKRVPDLRWEIRDVIVAGDLVIVRGEATGTPADTFMGVAYGGRSFRLMSIDIHAIRDGRLARSWHVEDWMGAARQLSAAP